VGSNFNYLSNRWGDYSGNSPNFLRNSRGMVKMKCPYCSDSDTTVIYICNTDDRKKYKYRRLPKKLRGNNTIRRRRKCLGCGYRFNTVESHAEGGE